jgi:hypothetical protein
MTGEMTARRLVGQGHLRRRSQKSCGEKRKDSAQFATRLRRMAMVEKVDFFDIRKAWDEYMVSSGHDYDWFLRDSIHGNSRGKQVVGRLLAEYFRPRDADEYR